MEYWIELIRGCRLGQLAIIIFSGSYSVDRFSFVEKYALVIGVTANGMTVCDSLFVSFWHRTISVWKGETK